MKKIYFSIFSMVFGLTGLSAQNYSTGPLSTGDTHSLGTVAPTGYTWSELQNANTLLGAGGSDTGTASFVVADDFVVPTGETWNVTSVSGFSYQTNYTGSTSPYTGFRIAIFSGVPGDGGTIVYGDLSANVYEDATEANIYRTGATAANTTRKIWKIDSSAFSHTLTAGTYWLAYQVVTATAVSGWIPVVTIAGEDNPTGANGRQRNTELVWSASLDVGSQVNNAFPFEINYTVLSTESFLENVFSVYPNPTENILNITSKGLDFTEATITDLNGRIVKKLNFDSALETQINISDLIAGVYMLTIKAEEGEITKKIMKK
jgi:hypothetical protein